MSPFPSLSPGSTGLGSGSGTGSSSRESRSRSAFCQSSVIVTDDLLFLRGRPRSGAGPIGLVSLLAAKALGATPIIITDLFQSRLDFAKSLHPDVQTVLVERGRTAEEVALQIREAAGGVDLKFALECTGVESSIRTCIFVSPSSFGLGLGVS